MSHRQNVHATTDHTFQLSHVILLRPKGTRARLFIAEEIESERVNNIDHLLGALIQPLFSFLGRGIGSNVECLAALGYLPAVDLIHYIVLLDQIIGIRDDLVTGNNVLRVS